MLDSFFRVFLLFSNATIVIPLIIIGYIWLNRPLFFQAACLVLVSMLCNVALKSSFRFPLSPLLGKEGFAFPSGHMQTSIVLYGWLFKSINSPVIRLLISVLLIGIGAGLMHFGYHNHRDILGAIFFGALLLIAYSLITRVFTEKSITYMLLFFSTLLMGYIGWVHEIQGNAWMAYYTLIGLLFSEQWAKNRQVSIGIVGKVVATLFCFLVLFVMHQLFSLFYAPSFLGELQWILIRFSIPISLQFANLIYPNKIP